MFEVKKLVHYFFCQYICAYDELGVGFCPDSTSNAAEHLDNKYWACISKITFFNGIKQSYTIYKEGENRSAALAGKESEGNRFF